MFWQLFSRKIKKLEKKMGNKRFSRNIIQYFNRIRIKSHFFSSCLSFLFVLIFISFRVDFQKDSFCISKGLLLHTKRTPFTPQKDSFYTSKGLLLLSKRTPFASPPYCSRAKGVVFGANFSFKFHNNYIKGALYECV